ncbi:MAG: BatA domain-containing protein [Novipirellula sp. JB048]
MTFLNATLLFGLAVVTVPIVLHFLSRREPKKVLFPSLRFLTQRYETNRSRLQIRRWWLLALRIAALAAVAFALARPVIHQSLSVTWITIGLLAAAGVGLLILAGLAVSRGHAAPLRYSLTGLAIATLLAALLWGGWTYALGPRPAIDSAAPIALAVVIDNSATSGWKMNDDDRIERIQSLADWIVARVPRTSRVAVVDRSSSPASFALDNASAVAQIEQIDSLSVVQPITTRIEAAIRLVQSSDLPSRAVIVISDLSESSWQAALESDATSQLTATDPAVSLTLFDLGDFSGTNRFLASLQVSESTPPASTAVSISARVGLSGNTADQDQAVTAELQMYDSDPGLPLLRDGQIQRPALRSVDRTSVRVAGTSTSEILLTVPPMEIGTHHGQVRLVGNDPLQIDDVRYFSIEVLSGSPVLIVSESEAEAQVIGQSITAPLLIDDPNAKYQVETIRYRDFAVVRLADFAAVMLLDPPNDVLQDPRLAQYIDQGGGVFATLGPAAEATSNASKTWPQLVRRWRVPEPGTFFQPINQSHPLLAPLSQISGGVPWNQFPITQYWQLDWQLESDPPSSFETRTLATFAGRQHASLVELLRPDTNGADGNGGRVLMMTTPIPALAERTRPWNDLFSGTDAWPSFLLVRQLADYLTQRSEGIRSPGVGQPYTIPIDTSASVGASAIATAARESAPVSTPSANAANAAAGAPASAAPASERLTRRFQLYPPGDAGVVPLDVDSDAAQVTVSNIRVPGTYWIRGKGFNSGFSANLPDNATRLDRVDPAGLLAAFANEEVRLVSEREAIDLSGDQDHQRVSLHSPAMLLALIVFLLEQILGNRFYRKRDSSRTLGKASPSPAETPSPSTLGAST